MDDKLRKSQVKDNKEKNEILADQVEELKEQLCDKEKIERQLKIQKLHIENIKEKMKDKLIYNYLIDVNKEVGEANEKLQDQLCDKEQ